MQNKILTSVIILFITIGSGLIVDSVRGVGIQLTALDRKIDKKFIGYDGDIDLLTNNVDNNTEEINLVRSKVGKMIPVLAVLKDKAGVK